MRPHTLFFMATAAQTVMSPRPDVVYSGTRTVGSSARELWPQDGTLSGASPDCKPQSCTVSTRLPSVRCQTGSIAAGPSCSLTCDPLSPVAGGFAELQFRQTSLRLLFPFASAPPSSDARTRGDSTIKGKCLALEIIYRDCPAKKAHGDTRPSGEDNSITGDGEEGARVHSSALLHQWGDAKAARSNPAAAAIRRPAQTCKARTALLSVTAVARIARAKRPVTTARLMTRHLLRKGQL
uniref:Uncharacterized protein n=1 Tax=Knipowitschia caucasica TaxID=637954 RepID=A0AAV2KQV1_KNICA